ncbi:hypothetical protein [Streptomyces tauricus]|uniref:hypothetical protein n=1 Tax=Streptomyces tauricus TaxID=68274 RepID=UPI00343A8102
MDTDKQVARGLIDIEAYLYREAHLTTARRRVADFTARAGGLTDEQRSAIERWYVEEQEHVARVVTEHIAESVGAAAAEHRVRFGHWLRGTLAAMLLITVLAIVCTAVVVGSVS